MTNREKYIDNATNEELALIISRLKYLCKNCPAYNECGKVNHHTCKSTEDLCKQGFLKWLSQKEVEETPKTIQLTEKEYKSLLDRVEKLEEFAKIKIDDFWNNIYKSATQEENDYVDNYMMKNSKKQE